MAIDDLITMKPVAAPGAAQGTRYPQGQLAALGI